MVAAIQADHPELNIQSIIVRKPDGTPIFGEVVSDTPIPELAKLALRATIDLIYITDAWHAEETLKWDLAKICLKRG